MAENNASLPPADVTLTNEDLAEMGERLEGDEDVERLIADLRAEREQAIFLRNDVRTLTEESKVAHEELRAAKERIKELEQKIDNYEQRQEW